VNVFEIVYIFENEVAEIAADRGASGNTLGGEIFAKRPA
jgi:hypothetical protein